MQSLRNMVRCPYSMRGKCKQRYRKQKDKRCKLCEMGCSKTNECDLVLLFSIYKWTCKMPLQKVVSQSAVRVYDGVLAKEGPHSEAIHTVPSLSLFRHYTPPFSFVLERYIP